MHQPAESTPVTRFYPAWLPRTIVWAKVGGLFVLLYLMRGRLPVGEWYGLLSLPAATLTDPIDNLASAINIPLVSALLFGLIGAISPCQLSTNLAAFAYVTRQVDRPALVTASGVAYLAGKMLVYTVVGLAAVILGIQLQQASIPVIVMARKTLGPMMFIIGLSMLGIIGLRISAGEALSAWFERRAAVGGVLGAFLLGVAFAFAFCPTLFVLFFTLTIPLAIASVGGFVYPAVFALGTTLPLLAFIAAAALGGMSLSGFLRQARGASRWLNRAVGVVFLLVGLNEIILYWLI